MFKKFYILAFSLLLLVHVSAQADVVSSEKFGTTELKEDAETLISDLKACHPALYEYTSQQEFDSLATEFKLNLTDSLTEQEFHLRVRKFLRVVGCGHTSAKPSEEWYSAMHEGVSAIPVHIFIHEGEMYVRDVFVHNADSLVGSRILAIGDVPGSEVLEELKSIVGRDGIGEVYVRRNIERIFQTYYLFSYGESAEYKLDLELSNGETCSVTLKGQRPMRRPVHKYHELVDELRIPQSYFGFTDSTRRIAVMDLNSFPSENFRKFYRKSCSAMTKNKSEFLILDLRGNSGGSFPNGNRLLQHLMGERFTMNFSRPRKQDKRSKHVKMNITGRIARFNYSIIPDRKRSDPDRNYQIRFKPIKPHEHTVRTYIITDGWSFSTASYVASKLQDAGRAHVIGEQTGGGGVAFNAVHKWDLTLPNSKLQVTIPMYHVDVLPTEENEGYGVLPAIWVEYDSVEERLSGVDLEMKTILRIIKRL